MIYRRVVSSRLYSVLQVHQILLTRCQFPYQFAVRKLTHQALQEVLVRPPSAGCQYCVVPRMLEHGLYNSGQQVVHDSWPDDDAVARAVRSVFIWRLGMRHSVGCVTISAGVSIAACVLDGVVNECPPSWCRDGTALKGGSASQTASDRFTCATTDRCPCLFHTSSFHAPVRHHPRAAPRFPQTPLATPSNPTFTNDDSYGPVAYARAHL